MRERGEKEEIRKGLNNWMKRKKINEKIKEREYEKMKREEQKWKKYK